MNGSSAFSGGSVVAAEVSDGVGVVSDGAVGVSDGVGFVSDGAVGVSDGAVGVVSDGVGVVSDGAVVGITVPRFTSSLHTVQYSSPV